MGAVAGRIEPFLACAGRQRENALAGTIGLLGVLTFSQDFDDVNPGVFTNGGGPFDELLRGPVGHVVVF